MAMATMQGSIAIAQSSTLNTPNAEASAPAAAVLMTRSPTKGPFLQRADVRDFITEMNKAGHIETLRSDVVSIMIEAKQVLIRAKFEGMRTRAPGPITGPQRGRRAR